MSGLLGAASATRGFGCDPAAADGDVCTALFKITGINPLPSAFRSEARASGIRQPAAVEGLVEHFGAAGTPEVDCCFQTIDARPDARADCLDLS